MKKQTGYNGNENLPKAGAKYALTMEQLEEYEKCMKSPVYFAQKYFKIVTVDDGLQPMKLYDFQREAAEAYLDTNKLILATSRQIGKTTIATVIALHYVMFNEWKTVFILGNKESTAVEVLERIQLAYEYLPSWLKVGVEEWNKTSVVFENGSKIRSAATSSDGIRGKSCVTGDMQVNVEIQHKSGNKEYHKLTIKELYELEIELKDRARFKIFGKDKFEHYDQVIYMGRKPIWRIHVNLSEEPIRCTGDHKFLMADGITWKEAKDLKKNDELYAGTLVTSARKQYTYSGGDHKEVIEDVYDVVNISNGNMFMTNGIITHNCNLLYLDECLTYEHKIKLQDKKTLEEKIVNIGELYDILTEEIENVKLNDKYNIFNFEYYYQDSVWYDFQGIKKTTTNHTVKLYLDDDSIIQGTLNHKVYKKNYIPMILDDFEEGFEFSAGIYVTKKEYCYDEVEVYDILNVNNKDHSYSIITNDGFFKSSNCAFIDNWNEFSASVLPVLSSGKKTKLIMTSTPKGLNHFYEYYIGAKNGTNGFKLIEVKWNDVPGRDEAWRHETLQTLNGDEIRFRQEYCVTGDTEVEILVEELNKTFVVPIEKLKAGNNNGAIKIKTPTGYSTFSGIKEKTVNEYIRITTNNGNTIKCTTNHPLLTVDGFKSAESLIESESVLVTNSGFDVVTKIETIQESIKVYDILDVELNHEYFTNGFISHNCVEFMGSSDNLIDGSVLKNIKAEAVPDKSIHVSPSYGYTVYENPMPGHSYVITVDVSRGKGLDYSAFQIIDVTSVPYKQVAVFKNNIISPRDFATFIVTSAKLYNDAMILVEVNDLGAQVSDIIYYDYEYENLIFTESAGTRGKRVSINGNKAADKGIRTTTNIKSTGCSMLKLLIEQRKLIINDLATIDELSTFSKKGKSYEAETGKHDDLVMCLVLFAWLTTDGYFKSLTDIDIMHSLREMNDEQIYNELTPFGIITSYGEYESESVNINGTDYNVYVNGDINEW